MEEFVLPKQARCPCCSFDMFLPPKLLQTESNNDTIGGEEDEPMDPQQALLVLLENDPNADPEATLVIVDTHGHAQLERDSNATYHISDKVEYDVSTRVRLKAVVCAVEPADWQDTLDKAARSKHYLPALGIHPWYLGEGLPDGWLLKLEKLLLEHPSALVGEIGLCKMARWTRQYSQGKDAAFQVQRQVFQQQLQLAARLRRPVSVHCVNQHGVLVSVLKEILGQNEGVDPRSLLPPTIAMHSFTGTSHHVKELLLLEDKLKVKSSISDPLFYFGFSHTVNYVMNTSDKSRRKAREAICAIPPNRLLVESDVHSSHDLVGGTAGAISYVAWARRESMHHVARCTSRNGIAFLTSVTSSS